MKAAEETLEAKQKKQSSFELSGKLAAETNRVRGITFLFTKPPYAKKPDIRWRLYVFKGGEALNGHFCDSCFWFLWQVEKEQPDGMLKNQVRPYMMDLGSTNKTFINDNPIEPQRYYELFEKDAIKFGCSWSLIPINPGRFSPMQV
ncbi:FHA domain-containing protein DDL-like isoform X2 [Populus nigra]|uniref:FHA domain-containing protein DDL-like isoform X2 n=1 Tax=Populus nigra TaxID=3691 RepID=UPI002B272D6F|nr:FHA domain-containing protein DDL-like isoform X2 [Populus nigra]